MLVHCNVTAKIQPLSITLSEQSVKWVKRKKCPLRYAKLQAPYRIVVISDSAFRKEDKTGLAMRGAIIGIAEKHEKHPGGKLHVIEFYARKQRRVVRSTFSAE
jgi:hypothetical protein